MSIRWFPRGVLAGLLLSFLGFSPALTEEQGSNSSRRFVPYSSFRPRFYRAEERFSLIASFFIVNTGRGVITDVTFRQPFPPEFTPKLVTDHLGSANRPEDFWQRIEDSTFVMFEPQIRPRQPTSIQAELTLKRRMKEFTIAPTQITFSTKNGSGQEETLPVTIDVEDYANHVGDLNRFLRRFADMGFDFRVVDRDEWEFAPIDAVARGRNPEGIIGVETADNGYSGHFRLHNGPPGDSLDILVVWKQTFKDERVQDEATVMNRLSDYLKWTGPFKFDPDNTSVTQGKFRKYRDAWIVEGRWLDTFPNRLGSGPVKAVVFFSPREDVEYYLVFEAQGRGMGPEKSQTPAPEKEAELMALADKLLNTFKSEIDPISHRR